MKTYKGMIAALAISLFVVGMTGCKAGPAERAGKQIDKAVEKTGETVEKVGKKIHDDMKGK